MATTLRNTLSEVMKLAWQFIKKNGYTMSEALKGAWMNIKLKGQMKKRIVKLSEKVIPTTQGAGRKMNDTCQVYFDTEKEEWRCFKKANLMRVA